MGGEQRVAYLFLSLLQARIGSSVVSRLGDLNLTNILSLPAAEIAAHARLTVSVVVVVVEAAEKSGALITARHALEAGCDVWAVPGPFAFAECRGSNALLADGAGVLWDLDSFVEVVAPEAATQRLPAAQDTAADVGPLPSELPEKEAAALAGVGFEPAGVDVVAKRVADLVGGVEMRELLSALALLELKGYVNRDASGAFVRNSIDDSSRNPRGTRW